MQGPLCKSSGKFISIEIDSPVSEKRFTANTRKLQETAATFGKVRLIVFFKPYRSLNSAEDLYDDLRFVKLCADQIDKIAVIADGASRDHWIGLFSLFSKVTMKFFHPGQRQEASSWIQSS